MNELDHHHHYHLELFIINTFNVFLLNTFYEEKVHVGNDQEKAQSEKESLSKNRGGEKNKPTIRHLYHENISLAE